MISRQSKVLVIEDERVAATGLKAFLKFLGHQPLMAESAGDGLDLARDYAPECVICAVGLRGMNGFSVARTLREHPRTASAWLIGLSDFGRSAFENLGDRSCFDRFLFRPVGIRELREALVRAEAAPAADLGQR